MTTIKVHRPSCRYHGVSFLSRYPRNGGCTCFQLRNGRYPTVLQSTDFVRGVAVFVTEWRRNYDKPSDYYVFAWTTAPDKAWENRAAAEAGNAKDRKYWVANNATQVREYMLRHPDEFSYHEHPTTTPPKDGIMNTEALRREAARLLIEADKIDARPSEPVGLRFKKKKREPQVNVIWWRMRFDKANNHRDGSGTRWYHYAAVKTSEGLWSTTGPQSPKSYTWDQLIDWIYANMENPRIYHGVVFDEITSA